MSATTRRTIVAGAVGALAVSTLATTAMAISSTADLTTQTAEQVAQSLVGPGVTVSNVTYTGDSRAAGTFAGAATSIGFESGVMLSSGDIATVVGANTSGSTTTSLGTPGDAQLDALVTPRVTQDAAVLAFDFTADADTVYFRYVFSSEEYKEWVNSSYNDVFAFWVNGENCALVPDPIDPTTTAAVTVNTVNHLVNTGLFVDNEAGVRATTMDGLTVPLTCMAAVNPGVTNTMRLAISDVSDSAYDSAVFLEEGSLSTTPPEGTGKVTGGGRLDVGDGFVTLGTNAIRDDAGLHGNLQVNDHRTGDKFHGYSVTSLSTTGTTAIWSGAGRWNGEDGYTFEATVVDNRNGNSAKKGSPDTVAITVYDAGGAIVWQLDTTDLTRGNMTVHQAE